MLALLFQLEQSQWWPTQTLAGFQARQLEVLLAHARATVPYYRARWTDAALRGGIASLPLLTRRDLQSSFDELKSDAVPAAHGGMGMASTSGSTGTPTRVMKTALTQLMWRAQTLRDHLWHRRDLRGRLAVIRQGPTPGSFDQWGNATDGLVTGPSAVLSPGEDIEAQLRWLQGQDPEYLLTYPSTAAALAQLSIEQRIRLPRLKEVRTLGEQLPDDLRQLCEDAWGVRLVDTYSAEEAGYLALQCPEHDHYHVPAESVLLEILDDDGRPCAPGQAGRVVITDLGNFATPLVRYEIGDFAVPGQPCACGRGLPVIERVLGRVRNLLVTADGRRYWPTFGVRSLGEVAPVRQAQFVQTAFDRLEARLVCSAPLTAAQHAAIKQRVTDRLPRGFEVTLVTVESIARGAGGKFEDFVCSLPTPIP